MTLFPPDKIDNHLVLESQPIYGYSRFTHRLLIQVPNHPHNHYIVGYWNPHYRNQWEKARYYLNLTDATLALSKGHPKAKQQWPDNSKALKDLAYL